MDYSMISIRCYYLVSSMFLSKFAIQGYWNSIYLFRYFDDVKWNNNSMIFIWCYYKISNIFIFHSKSTKTQFLLFQKNHLFKFTNRDWTLLPIIRYYPVPNIACHVSLSLSCLCCVFRPAFECCADPKAGQITFFQLFSTFSVHLKSFSVISRLKSK